jgi:hypothetical protein
MIRVKKKTAKQFATLLAMILFVAVMPGFTRICENGAGTGYDESQASEGAAVGDIKLSIEDYIERGAGYFLMAKKEVDTMLRMVELQNINGLSIEELKAVTDRALDYMNRALDTYSVLVRRVEATPYDSRVIARLKQFDYNAFGKQFRLNPDVFNKVEGYLKNGDLNGIFKRKIPIFSKILELLKEAKSDLNNNNIPKLNILWTLNETFSRSSLFGSYVARVFQSLNFKKKSNLSLEMNND